MYGTFMQKYKFFLVKSLFYFLVLVDLHRRRYTLISFKNRPFVIDYEKNCSVLIRSVLKSEQDAYHRRKHESRVRILQGVSKKCKFKSTLTYCRHLAALIRRQIIMRKLQVRLHIDAIEN